MHRQSHQVRSGKRSPYYAMKLLRWLLGMREPTPMNIQLSELDRNWAAQHFDPKVQYLAALVGSIICDQLGVTLEHLAPGTRFIEDLGADGLDSVELLMAIEEEFRINVSDDDATKLERINDLVVYLHNRSLVP